MKNSFKAGDRVRWNGAYDPTVANRSALGQLGTVTSDTNHLSETTTVRWDDPNASGKYSLGTGIFSDNLELVAPGLDFDEPLLLQIRSSATPVGLISKTPEGGAVIDLANADRMSAWCIVDAAGKILKLASGNCPGDLKVVNAPKPVNHKFKVTVGTDGTPYFSPMTSGTDAHVEVVVQDGKVKEVRT